MRLTIPAWLNRTMKYAVICALSGLTLLILGIAVVGILISLEMNRRDAYYQETVLYTATSPDNHSFVSVIRNDYGKPCGAGVKVVVSFKDRTSARIFSDEISCDASVRWLNTNQVSIETISAPSANLQKVTVDITKVERYADED